MEEALQREAGAIPLSAHWSHDMASGEVASNRHE